MSFDTTITTDTPSTTDTNRKAKAKHGATKKHIEEHQLEEIGKLHTARLEAKEDIVRLQNQVQQTEYEMAEMIIDAGFTELLTINYSKLSKMLAEEI